MNPVKYAKKAVKFAAKKGFNISLDSSGRLFEKEHFIYLSQSFVSRDDYTIEFPTIDLKFISLDNDPIRNLDQISGLVELKARIYACPTVLDGIRPAASILIPGENQARTLWMENPDQFVDDLYTLVKDVFNSDLRIYDLKEIR